MRIKRFRRFFQISTLVAIFIIPLLNVLEINFIKGTFYSMDIGDVAMADPLAILQAMISASTFNLYMLVSIVIPILLMMLLGRVWCSWFCPYYLMTECLVFVRQKLKLSPLKPAYHQLLPARTNIIRFLFLVVGILITGVAGIPLLNLISAPGIISSQALVLVKFHYVTFELVFIGILLFVELFFVYKFWCRFLCPTGTFLSLFKWNKGMRIQKLHMDCSMCQSCVSSCPMALNPMTEGNHSLCHNCGDCVDACPDNRKRETLKFKC